jgi:hypothetical protein
MGVSWSSQRSPLRGSRDLYNTGTEIQSWGMFIHDDFDCHILYHRIYTVKSLSYIKASFGIALTRQHKDRLHPSFIAFSKLLF